MSPSKTFPLNRRAQKNIIAETEMVYNIFVLEKTGKLYIFPNQKEKKHKFKKNQKLKKEKNKCNTN